jgi:divalent metal cation (Fe/Co/Zn/Cd) transporter
MSYLKFGKSLKMEVKRKSTRMYWVLFFISTLALLVAIFLHWPWLTLLLPFVTTFFVLAMDII